MDLELLQLLVAEIERHLGALETSPTETRFRTARHAVHSIKGAAGMAGARDLAARCGRLEESLESGELSVEIALPQVVATLREGLRRIRSGLAPSTWPKPDSDLRPVAIDPSIAPQYAAEILERLTAIDDVLASDARPSIHIDLRSVPPLDPSPFVARTERGTEEISSWHDANRPVRDDAYDALFRHVHTMKGAASAVGDEPLAWFCHGLEDALCALCTKDGQPVARDLLDLSAVSEAARALVERFRPVLSGLVSAPEATLSALRTRDSEHARAASLVRIEGDADIPGRRSTSDPARRSSIDGGFPDARSPELRETGPGRGTQEPGRLPMGGDMVRVSLAALEQVSTTLASVARGQERSLRSATQGIASSRRLRRLRGELAEALRVIGPARPWGTPAAAIDKIHAVAEALSRSAAELEADSWGARSADAEFRTRISTGLRTLSDLERVPASGLFSRFRQTVEAEARRSGKRVAVIARGGDELIERRLFEALVDPLLQIARNVVAHGLEDASERVAAGKDAAGRVEIVVERRVDGGERLLVTVSDDGPGVDFVALQARAEALGYEEPSDDSADFVGRRETAKSDGDDFVRSAAGAGTAKSKGDDFVRSAAGAGTAKSDSDDFVRSAVGAGTAKSDGDDFAGGRRWSRFIEEASDDRHSRHAAPPPPPPEPNPSSRLILPTEPHPAEDPEHAARLLRLLLLPGFSTITADEENDPWIAGRGVGLDVVYATTRALGGEVFLSSDPGEGFRVELSLPSETSFLGALVVISAGYTFAIPAGSIDHVDLVEDPEERDWDAPYRTPSIPLADLLGLAPSADPVEPRERRAIVLRQGPPAPLDLAATGEGPSPPLCIEVDRVVGVESGGTRPLAERLAALGPYSYAFSGTLEAPVPVLDVLAMMRLARRRRVDDHPHRPSSRRP